MQGRCFLPLFNYIVFGSQLTHFHTWKQNMRAKTDRPSLTHPRMWCYCFRLQFFWNILTNTQSVYICFYPYTCVDLNLFLSFLFGSFSAQSKTADIEQLHLKHIHLCFVPQSYFCCLCLCTLILGTSRRLVSLNFTRPVTGGKVLVLWFWNVCQQLVVTCSEHNDAAWHVCNAMFLGGIAMHEKEK